MHRGTNESYFFYQKASANRGGCRSTREAREGRRKKDRSEARFVFLHAPKIPRRKGSTDRFPPITGARTIIADPIKPTGERSSGKKRASLVLAAYPVECSLALWPVRYPANEGCALVV